MYVCKSLFYCTDCDDVSQITSEELSVFYKDFLDKKYHDQMTFTRCCVSYCKKHTETET